MSDIPDNDEPTRGEMALARQALRQCWGVPPETRAKLLTQLMRYIDGDRASDRTIIAAAKTLAEFMRLDLTQQAIDIEREKLDGGKTTEIGFSEFVSAAEARADQRRAERDREREHSR